MYMYVYTHILHICIQIYAIHCARNAWSGCSFLQSIPSCVPALVPSFLRSFLRSFVRSADDRDLRIKFDNTETKPNQTKPTNTWTITNTNTETKPKETFTSYKHNYLMYLYLCELIWANLIWSWFVFVVQPECIRLYIHIYTIFNINIINQPLPIPLQLHANVFWIYFDIYIYFDRNTWIVLILILVYHTIYIYILHIYCLNTYTNQYINIYTT